MILMFYLFCPIPLLSTKTKVRRFQIFTGTCAYYIATTDDLQFGIRVHVSEDNTIHFATSVVNLCNDRRDCFVSAYLNPFLRNPNL